MSPLYFNQRPPLAGQGRTFAESSSHETRSTTRLVPGGRYGSGSMAKEERKIRKEDGPVGTPVGAETLSVAQPGTTSFFRPRVRHHRSGVFVREHGPLERQLRSPLLAGHPYRSRRIQARGR